MGRLFCLVEWADSTHFCIADFTFTPFVLGGEPAPDIIFYGAVQIEFVTVSVAALTLYDMCKAIDKGMVIGDIRLVSKTKEKV